MNALEKILKEIKEAKEKINLDSSESNINTALLEGVFGGLSMAEGIIQSHFAKNAGWIPVTERLPDNADEFVLATVSGRYDVDTYFENAIMLANYDKNVGWIIEKWDCWKNPNVTAWMPLPEAYKENNNGREES